MRPRVRPAERPACHWIVSDTIREEIEARGWTDPVTVIAELANTSKQNVERLLQLDHRLTRVECWIMERAFGLSDAFFVRLQNIAEKKYPLKVKS